MREYSLCGISSRFRLLSPCTRQVVHALLTRPPLGQISLGFNLPPFDLHVLGTPPAFILSQDQTLKFSLKRSVPLTSSFYLVSFFKFFSSLNFQGWFVFYAVQLSRFYLLSSLIYQRQLVYNIIFKVICQLLFFKTLNIGKHHI